MWIIFLMIMCIFSAFIIYRGLEQSHLEEKHWNEIKQEIEIEEMAMQEQRKKANEIALDKELDDFVRSEIPWSQIATNF